MVNTHIRIAPPLRDALEKFCAERGIAVNRFVQETLGSKLEELMDIEDLRKLRGEPTQPLLDVLVERSRKS